MELNLATLKYSFCLPELSEKTSSPAPVWQRLLRFHSAIKNLGNLTFEIHDLQTETMKKKLNKLVLNDDEQKVSEWIKKYPYVCVLLLI